MTGDFDGNKREVFLKKDGSRDILPLAEILCAIK